MLIWLFGLQGAGASVLLRSVLALVLIHRASQQYFVVAYEYRRLAVLAALLLAFYFLALPLDLLAWQVAVSVKLVLLGLFVGLILNSPVLKPEERAFVKRAARRALGLHR